MYNGLKIAHAAAPELGLGETINHMDTKYAIILDNNNEYLNLSSIESAK
jgi:hypothetical protein